MTEDKRWLHIHLNVEKPLNDYYRLHINVRYGFDFSDPSWGQRYFLKISYPFLVNLYEFCQTLKKEKKILSHLESALCFKSLISINLLEASTKNESYPGRLIILYSLGHSTYFSTVTPFNPFISFRIFQSFYSSWDAHL